ncbi:PKD domain-containing protein [Halorussus ruber]|uniref:PKD domain-containing protein n=1 Tax=Halorussus ruber TaxID=1126238 RepID=UPI00109286CD|nr:PKD domain-containing protein [Halorussus ruber]
MARKHPSLRVSDSGGARRTVALLATFLLVASVLAPAPMAAAVGLGDHAPVVGAAGNADEATVANDASTTVANDDSTTVTSDGSTTTVAEGDTTAVANDDSVTIRGQVEASDGAPATNDSVLLGSADRNRTDERGRFHVYSDDNRSYDLTYRQRNGTTGDGLPAIYAIGRVNSTDRNRTVSLPAASVLNLTVVAENGTAVPNATVRLTHARGGANATLSGETDAQGRVRVGGHVGVELAGTVTVSVEAPNASLADREVTVPADAGDRRVVLDLTEETPPTLRYDVSARTANVSELVTFDATNSTDPSGIAETTWTFPADTVSRAAVGYRFSERGNYSVNLSATDGAGNVNRTTVPIRIVDRRDPVADLAVTEAGENATNREGNATTVTVNESVTFDATDSFDSETGIAEYRWDFDGDGSFERNTSAESPATASPATVSHAYADSGRYNATVEVTDAAGNLARAERRIVVEIPPPTANFTISDARPSIGEAVEFNASVTAAVGTVTEYAWEIEYPSSSFVLDGRVVNQEFPDSGTYNVTLTVTDEEGQTDELTRSVEVPNKPPEADARAGESVVAGSLFALDGRYSTDPDDSFSVAWNQTEGPPVELSNDSAENPAFTAPEVNRTTTLRFNLTVTDDHGATDEDAVAIAVVPSSLPNVSHAPEEPTVNESVAFEVNRSGEYGWDFDGDGTVEATPESANVTERNATHRFDAPGEYDVTLVDAAGREVVRNVTVALANESETGGSGTGDSGADGNATDGGENATETGGNATENETDTSGGGAGGGSGAPAGSGGGSSGGSGATGGTSGNSADGATGGDSTGATGGGGAGGTGGATGGAAGGATGGGSAGGTGGSDSAGGSAGGTGGSDSAGDSADDNAGADESERAEKAPSPAVTVERVGDSSDRVVAAVENASGGDRAAVEFPEEFGRNRSAFETLSVVTDGASKFSLSVGALSTPPTGTPSPNADAVVSYLRVGERNITDTAIRSARFRFRVAASALDELGVSPDTVGLYRFHDGEWQTLETRVLKQVGDFYRFEATSPGFSVFAVGVGSAGEDDSEAAKNATTADENSASDEDSESNDRAMSDQNVKSGTPPSQADESSGISDSMLSLGLFVAALLAAALWGYLLS